MSDERKEMDKLLITAMSHMKTMYEDNNIPWSKENEDMFQKIRNHIIQKPSVSKTRLEECTGWDGDYLDLKALMYELDVEITPRTKPVPQPIEKESIKEELIRWLEDVYYSADEEFWGRHEDKKKIWQIKAFLQQKPIDEKYVERKLIELIQLNSRFPKSVQQRDELNRKFITQIIKDARGRGE